MSKIIKWFKDNEAVIVITVVLLLIILFTIGILVGIGFLIDLGIKKNKEKFALENYKLTIYKNKPIIKKDDFIKSEFITNEEKNLLIKYREFKKQNPNKKLKIISRLNDKSIIIFTN